MGLFLADITLFTQINVTWSMICSAQLRSFALKVQTIQHKTAAQAAHLLFISGRGVEINSIFPGLERADSSGRPSHFLHYVRPARW